MIAAFVCPYHARGYDTRKNDTRNGFARHSASLQTSTALTHFGKLVGLLLPDRSHRFTTQVFRPTHRTPRSQAIGGVKFLSTVIALFAHEFTLRTCS